MRRLKRVAGRWLRRFAFGSARRAMKRGDFVRAERVLRRARRVMPAHPLVAKRLGGVLEQQGKRLEREGCDREALERYSEAFALSPNRIKIQRRLADLVARLLMRAPEHLDGEFPFLAEGFANVSGGPMARISSLMTLAESAPLNLRDRDDSRRWVVVIDAGVDMEALPLVLAGMGDAQAYCLERPPEHAVVRSPVPMTSLTRAGDVSFEGDADLCRTTDRFSQAFLDALRSHLDVPRVGGVDVLETMSFAVDDVCYLAGKALKELRTLLAEVDEEDERVVFVLGSGALAEVADVMGLPDETGYLWCSPSRACYDTEVRAWPPDDPPVVDDRFTNGTAPAASPPPARVSANGGSRPTCAVIATPSARHVNNIAAVAAALPPDIDVVTLPLSMSEQDEPQHAAYRRLASARSNVTVSPRLAGAWSGEVSTRVRNRAVDDALAALRSDVLVLQGLDLLSVVEDGLRSVVTKRLPRDLGFARAFEAYLDETPPDVVLLSPDRTSQLRIVCSMARQRGIPTVFPQLVLFSESPRYKELQSDYICVIDDHTRALFVDHFGARAEQVKVTGIPHYDSLVERRERGLRPPPDTGRVLLALQSFATEYNEQLVGVTARAVAAANDGTLVIKLHPHDSASMVAHHHELAASILGPERVRVYWTERDVHDLIVDSDLVVSAFSNVLLEAAVLDRLCVCANFTDEPLPVPFVEMGAAAGAESPEAAVELVSQLLTDADAQARSHERRRGYLERNSHLLSGRSSERIAQFVESLARQHHSHAASNRSRARGPRVRRAS